MKTILLKVPCKKALLTSICLKDYPLEMAKVRMSQIVVSFTMRLNVSLKSTPENEFCSEQSSQAINLSFNPIHPLTTNNIMEMTE